MKGISLLLLTIISLPIYATGDSGDKNKPVKGKEYYYKYEREEVSYYRDRTQFIMPEPKVVTTEITEETPNGISLSHLFNFGKKVHVDADIQLETLVKKDIKIKEGIKEVSGFRIQIFAGSNRQAAWKIKGSAMNRFPELPHHLEYQSPNYVVRIGDFMDKEDAILTLKAMREVFRGAFIVPDRVKVPRVRPQEDGLDTPTDNSKSGWDKN